MKIPTTNIKTTSSALSLCAWFVHCVLYIHIHNCIYTQSHTYTYKFKNILCHFKVHILFTKLSSKQEAERDTVLIFLLDFFGWCLILSCFDCLIIVKVDSRGFYFITHSSLPKLGFLLLFYFIAFHVAVVTRVFVLLGIHVVSVLLQFFLNKLIRVTIRVRYLFCFLLLFLISK